jgi:DNA (cytosine-5)-methyltransferase 1
MKYFSMFSGVGGFELGLDDHDCIGFSEKDTYAIQTYKQHFTKVKNYGDATKINTRELPDFDLLCGGFPCQAFSVAGKREGFKDTRGTLFFEITRVAQAKRPTYILLENVKGLLNHEKGRTFTKIIQTLDELGYDYQWMVLNSKFFGVPQTRERVFIIANIRGTSRPEILPFRQGSSKPSQELNKKTEASQPLVATYWKGGKGTHIQRVPLKFLERNQRKISGDYAYTIDSANTGGVIDLKGTRRFTPLECERLQGFPDNWSNICSDTQRYIQMGNAVTVNVIKAIAERLT